MWNLNFIREADTKDVLEKCKSDKLTSREILDYLYKYANIDSHYIYEHLPDVVQKNVDELIIDDLVKNYQLIKETKDSISNLDILIKNLKKNDESFNSDYYSSLFNLRMKAFDRLIKLKTYSKFGPYMIDINGNVQFDDNLEDIETSLFRLKRRFTKLSNLINNIHNDDECLVVEEIVRSRLIIDNLETELKEIDDNLTTLKEDDTEYCNLIDKKGEIYKLLRETQDNTPKLKYDRYEIIQHELNSVRNRIVKMRNHYPWCTAESESESHDELAAVDEDIKQLQQRLDGIFIS
jgi:hypothetical protein